jgi:hypothetical protein
VALAQIFSIDFNINAPFFISNIKLYIENNLLLAIILLIF